MYKSAPTLSPSNPQENELKNKFNKGFLKNSINTDALPDGQVSEKYARLLQQPRRHLMQMK